MFKPDIRLKSALFVTDHGFPYRVNTIFSPHHDYLRLGKDKKSLPQACKASFRAHIKPEKIDTIRYVTNGNYVLGDNRFQEEITRMLNR